MIDVEYLISSFDLSPKSSKSFEGEFFKKMEE